MRSMARWTLVQVLASHTVLAPASKVPASESVSAFRPGAGDTAWHDRK